MGPMGASRVLAEIARRAKEMGLDLEGNPVKAMPSVNIVDPPRQPYKDAEDDLSDLVEHEGQDDE